MNFTFKISVYSGDIIYTLASIKQVCERYGKKAEIYIWLDRKWHDSVQGQTHPYGISQYALDMIKPLLESQPYVTLCKAWEGEEVKQDLDEIRTKTHSTMPHGCIIQWPGQIWPDMICDSSKPWITVITDLHTSSGIKRIYTGRNDVVEVQPTGCEGKIIINRTARWRNDMMHYYHLREYRDQLIFAGLPEEHAQFCKEWDLDIPHLKVNDFLELAVAIKTCKLFIGNQSLCFALAEAMKVPRILEICPYAPNVIPSGPGGYYFLHQSNFEFLIKDLTK